MENFDLISSKLDAYVFHGAHIVSLGGIGSSVNVQPIPPVALPA